MAQNWFQRQNAQFLQQQRKWQDDLRMRQMHAWWKGRQEKVGGGVQQTAGQQKAAARKPSIGVGAILDRGTTLPSGAWSPGAPGLYSSTPRAMVTQTHPFRAAFLFVIGMLVTALAGLAGGALAGWIDGRSAPVAFVAIGVWVVGTWLTVRAARRARRGE